MPDEQKISWLTICRDKGNEVMIKKNDWSRVACGVSEMLLYLIEAQQ